MKRKQKEAVGVTALCQLRSGREHPFGMLKHFTPPRDK